MLPIEAIDNQDPWQGAQGEWGEEMYQAAASPV